MSELQTRFIDDTYAEYYNTGKHELAQVYLKSEADKAIADLEESHKMEVEQLLMEIVELKEQVHDYGLGLYVMQARAEKEARHDKYKRCLAMAKWCDVKATIYRMLINEETSKINSRPYFFRLYKIKKEMFERRSKTFNKFK